MPYSRNPSLHQPDYLLLIYFGILLVFGLAMLASASAPVGYAKFGDSYFFIKRQLLFGVLPGLVLFLVFAKFQYRLLLQLDWLIFLGCIAVLLAVFIPGLGSNLGTAATSWLVIGPLSVQPAEAVKLGLIIFLASYLAKKGSQLQSFQEGLLPALILAGALIFLVLLQPDVGTATILFSIVFGMLFASEAKLSHLTGLAILGLIGFGIMVAVAPYRIARFTTFLHPELDPQGIGYQINQAFMAIGSGGVFGLGFGHSQQKFQYLPEVHADSIFAIIGEEMGFVVSAGLIVLLILISKRITQNARSVPDKAGQLLLVGIMIWFMTQSLFNIGAMVGVLPLTGVPLPFVSHGGTALLVALSAVGIVVNVSKQTVRYVP
ncbi:MAG: putative peptidoglycan glycosyltransferase FtsW [Patescibacteria group bacterium]|mgnify:CR=1 FL=1